MKRISFSFLFLLAAIVVVLGTLFSFQFENALTLSQSLTLFFNPEAAQNFDEYFFIFGTAPRWLMALVGGAILGLVGSLLQQLTQNPMTSPLTLGTSSGAWFAIVLVSAFFPELVNDVLALCAFTGALVAFGLIMTITGFKRLSGVALVISGMVINLLFGALATAIVLIKADFIQNVFLWGAGDLSQNGWSSLIWLAQRAAIPMGLIFLFAPRALALISLGEQAAKARGLSVVQVFFIFTLLGVWIVSSFVTVAGVINFTGLIAPNIVRACGCRSPAKQLTASSVLGAGLLLLTDCLANVLSAMTENIVPTGVVSAVIGTPIFIWIARITMSGSSLKDGFNMEQRAFVFSHQFSINKVIMVMVTLFVGLLVINGMLETTESGWQWTKANDFTLSLRWPRLLTACFAGAALACAGVILQRLINNPLASPDILGVSSGASCSLVVAALTLGISTTLAASAFALTGSFIVLMILLMLSRKSRFSPSLVVLFGIALSALLDSVTTLMLSRGTMENYYILQWLSGSTYRATAQSAMLLSITATVLILIAMKFSRAMTLLSVNRDFAQSRGLCITKTTGVLLFLCAMLCSVATASTGPVAFVGLVAPHMALLLGCRTVSRQIIFSVFIGILLVGWADMIGQIMIAPAQIPAGTLASILGAGYFLFLLFSQRMSRSRRKFVR